MNDMTTADYEASRDAIALVTAVLAEDHEGRRRILAGSPDHKLLLYAMTAFAASAVLQLAFVLHCEASEILQSLGLGMAREEDK